MTEPPPSDSPLTLFLGSPPPFAQSDRGRVCPDLDAVASALADVAGHATVVVTADVPHRELSALGERFPTATWWCAHGSPCADDYARRGLPRALAHAVRSPLGVLEGAVEELEDRLDDKGPEWGMMRRSIARLRRLSVTLSDLASAAGRRAAEGSAPPAGGGAPLNAVVRGAWLEAQRQLPLRREIELEMPAEALSERPPNDDEALERALRELFVNARQHGAGVVRVQASSDAEGAHLDVIDDGPGPGGAADPSNWSPFVSAEERGARSDLGLGLYLAHDSMRRLGGRLRVVEGEGGKGTRARLTWPG